MIRREEQLVGAPSVAEPMVARPKRRFSEEKIAGFLTISPWAIGFIIFTAFPVVASLYFSFTRYDVVTSPRWVGLANYERLFTRDELFPTSIRNSLIYTALYVPLHTATALGIALLLHEARAFKGFFRTLFYLPAITPAVATSFLWISILNPNDGLVNRMLRWLHLPAPGWTTDPFWIKPTVVISQLWVMGGAMIILLAALNGVPTTLYEAVKLDGGGVWRRFRDVTLPMISGVLFFVATVGLIGSIQVFTQGYVMFHTESEPGGPENAGLFAVMYLFDQAFSYFRMGYAAAIAWVLFLIILTLTLFQFKLSQRWVYYESGGEG
jgi:multiple sugar transport system permease protein